MSSTRPSPSRPVVLVVAPSDRLYRGYCLESVAAAYDTVVITPRPITWEHGLVIDHETADPYDREALLTAGELLASRHPVAAVLTWNETLLVATAHLAQHLGVLTDDPQVLHACRDKATSRAQFARHAVPSAQSIKVASLLESALAAESIGYPAVLKPHGSGLQRRRDPRGQGRTAPRGVRVRDRLYANLHGGDSNDVLVEEYLDGPEISVECITHRGQTTAVAVTRKELGFEPYFEEIGHSVDAADPLLAETGPIATAAVAALGVTTGISHVELRLTATGPRIIEVNQRIGGDLIGRLVQLATGIDLPRAAADLALGIAPDLTPTRRQAAAVRLLYPEVSGTVIERGIDADLVGADWLTQVSWISEVGDQVVLPPEGDVDVARVGLVVVTAADAAQAATRIEEAQDHITVVVYPAPETPGASTGGQVTG